MTTQQRFAAIYKVISELLNIIDHADSVYILKQAAHLAREGMEDDGFSDREKRLIAAIEWACGIRGDFSPSPPPDLKSFVSHRNGPYWWRKELRERAGLVYSEDCKKLIPPND